MRWIAVVVLAACGPSLEAIGARHVIIPLDHQAIALGCEDPCRAILRPGERFVQCQSQEFGWLAAVPLVDKTRPNPNLDLKATMGPVVPGFAVCKVGS